MAELPNRRGDGPRDKQAGVAKPEPADGMRPSWNPPKFRELVGPAADPAPRSPTGSLIEAYPEELQEETPVQRARPTKHPHEPNGIEEDEPLGGVDDIREQFIRALACWHASRDFQEWCESGQYQRRWRMAWTPHVRVYDLESEQYFER